MEKLNRYIALSKLPEEMFPQNAVEDLRVRCGVRTVDDFINYASLGPQKGYLMEVTGWFSGQVDDLAELLDNKFPRGLFHFLTPCFAAKSPYVQVKLEQSAAMSQSNVPDASLPQPRI